jgi:ABC-type sugar transport system ATPase subunit
MIVVTHDPTDAWALGRRVGLLEYGTLTHWDSPASVAVKPSTVFAAVSLGRLCLLDGTVTRGDSPGGWTFSPRESTVVVPLPLSLAQVLDLRPVDNLTLGLRHEDVTLIPQGPRSLAFPGGVITSAEPDGSGWTVSWRLGATPLKGTVPAGSPPPVGPSPTWYWTPSAWHAFDTRTGMRLGL